MRSKNWTELDLKTLSPFAKEEDPQGTNPIQGGLLAQDFHIVLQEEMEEMEEMEEAEGVEEVEEVEDHLLIEEETQMIEAMAQS